MAATINSHPSLCWIGVAQSGLNAAQALLTDRRLEAADGPEKWHMPYLGVSAFSHFLLSNTDSCRSAADIPRDGSYVTCTSIVRIMYFYSASGNDMNTTLVIILSSWPFQQRRKLFSSSLDTIKKLENCLQRGSIPVKTILTSTSGRGVECELLKALSLLT